MPSGPAATRARSASREAMATTRDLWLRCIAGITFLTAMSAAPRTPQRTGAVPPAPLSAPGTLGRRRGRRRPVGGHRLRFARQANPPDEILDPMLERCF